MTGRHNAKDLYGDGELPADADLAVAAPDEKAQSSDHDSDDKD